MCLTKCSCSSFFVGWQRWWWCSLKPNWFHIIFDLHTCSIYVRVERIHLNSCFFSHYFRFFFVIFFFSFFNTKSTMIGWQWYRICTANAQLFDCFCVFFLADCAFGKIILMKFVQFDTHTQREKKRVKLNPTRKKFSSFSCSPWATLVNEHTIFFSIFTFDMILTGFPFVSSRSLSHSIYTLYLIWFWYCFCAIYRAINYIMYMRA